MLGNIKDCHGDIEGACYQKDCYPHLEEVLEKTEAVPIVQVVLLSDHSDQLVTENKRDDHACNRDDHCLR